MNDNAMGIKRKIDSDQSRRSGHRGGDRHALQRRGLSVFAWLFALCGLSVPAAAWAQSADGTLRFDRDNYLAGRLAPSDKAGMLRWQHPAFVEAFEFPLKAIASASFEMAGPEPQGRGAFGIELSSGTRFFGRPVALDQEWLTVESPSFGQRRVRRQAVRKIFRWDDGQASLYHGPGSLRDWQVVAPEQGQLGQLVEVDELMAFLEMSERAEGAAEVPPPFALWKEVAGRLEASGTAGPLYRDVGLEKHVTVELELAWDEPPNFVIALGCDGTPGSSERAFRLEVWNGSIVLLRELGQWAAVRVVKPVDELQGRLQLTIDLDQERGRVAVFDVDGRQLVEQEIADDTAAMGSGIQVENISGHLRLERIDVLRGGAARLNASAADQVQVVSADGVQATGTLRGLSDEAWELEIAGEPQRFALRETMLIVFPGANSQSENSPSSPEVSSDRAAVGDETTIKSGLQPQYFALVDGTRLLGQFVGNDAETIRVEVEDWAEPVAVPLGMLRGIFVSDRPEVKAGLMRGRSGVLVMPGTRARGVLVDAVAAEAHSGLRFAPRWTEVAAHLRHTASGEIVYRDDSTAGEPRRPAGANGNNTFLGAVVTAIAGAGSSEGPRLIHLRSGDAVPARVKSISRAGILVDSVVTGEKLIPHAEMKAVELNSMAGELSLEEAKRQRLLTIPRIRKNSPPTHLLVSTDGDYLRGNLVQMDAETTVVESRLEPLELPTRYVAKIIWLHPEEIEGEAEPAEDNEAPATKDASPGRGGNAPGAAPQRLLMQAVQRSGIRLTFNPEESGGGEVVGSSPLLGACLVDLRTVDRLMFGDAIAAARDELLFYQWRLTHAPEPSVYAEGSDADGQAMAGTQSPLVGQPAPEFNLKTLAGKPISVEQFRGRVLVLDFWATWCGPCLRAMPEIHEAVEQFPGDQVQLVAVNLQESATQIQETLERLGLDPLVAMDIDGVAAGRYRANAIPQTVVIDRDGVIQKLFVGGGDTLRANLVAAIEASLSAGTETKSAP